MDSNDHRLTDHDRQMITAAFRRAPVFVEMEGMRRRATLIAWCPRRSNGTHRLDIARVKFGSGNMATVKKNTVSLAEETSNA
jgi:hypothetical protein